MPTSFASRVGLGAVVLLLGTAAAFAADDPALARYLNDPVEQQHVVSAAQRSTVFLQNPCPDARFTIEARFVIYKNPTFDSAGALGDGAWKEIINAEGCSSRRLLNVLVSAQGPNNVAVIPLLPGTTHADPVLQKDAVGFAVAVLSTASGALEPNCKINYVADTELLEQETTVLPGAKGPSWRELWTFAACTQSMRVPMRFVADATGTTISAGPNTAIRIEPLTDSSR